ncbi:MAG: ABC transporter ATP-binding protein [Pyrinomonadaceae bacterium MAG19_C2-C3]|nr:ABC transporter ATP-binding protein [Pyrinomonadaceae bacterium MAG19_C2-C3]
MTAVLELDNLTKDYEIGFWRKRPQRALDALTLSVNKDEIFGFLGANGAGKTTTIKILMSLTAATVGGARILGRPIDDTEMHRHIGYLPERPYFYDYLTAREFLEYCGELFGFDAQTRRQRAKEKLAEVKLDERSWDKQLRRFSKGMLQRVGLAQALVNNPSIVFLDEPMSGLDPIGRREVRDLVASLPARGTTVFFCSHILSDVEMLCDRAAVMRSGKLAHLGTLDELRAQTGDGSMEITLAAAHGNTGVLVAHLQKANAQTSSTLVEQTPSGARVVVTDELAIDEILRQAREVGGRLLAVQKVGGGLEELFVKSERERQKHEDIAD